MFLGLIKCSTVAHWRPTGAKKWAGRGPIASAAYGNRHSLQSSIISFLNKLMIEFKLQKHLIHLDIWKHFFSFGVIHEWNSLPATVVNSHTVDTFKKKLDRYFKNGGFK